MSLICGLLVYDIRFALAAAERTYSHRQLVCASAVGKCSAGHGADLLHTVIQAEIKDCAHEKFTLWIYDHDVIKGNSASQ